MRERVQMSRTVLRSTATMAANLAGVVVFGLILCLTVASAVAQTIVDEWAAVKAPAPPELKPVKIDPKVTALLILDIQKQNCNNERRPRCVASVPKIQKLLSQARAQGVPVIYTVSSSGTVADILSEVAPREGEPLVRSSSDKFYGTDLEKILKDKGIKTVIAVGTAAHGAVLYTGSEAAKRGFKVIVPVDGMSAESAYIDQYVTSHFATSPATRGVILTKIDMIQF
jgi:nicotinamidase-related amidase